MKFLTEKYSKLKYTINPAQSTEFSSVTRLNCWCTFLNYLLHKRLSIQYFNLIAHCGLVWNKWCTPATYVQLYELFIFSPSLSLSGFFLILVMYLLASRSIVPSFWCFLMLCAEICIIGLKGGSINFNADWLTRCRHFCAKLEVN